MYQAFLKIGYQQYRKSTEHGELDSCEKCKMAVNIQFSNEGQLVLSSAIVRQTVLLCPTSILCASVFIYSDNILASVN